MPRIARPITPHVPHHLISRFVNREFRMHGPEERRKYLNLVQRSAARTNVSLNAYGLMSSHVHWAVTGSEDPLSTLLHPLHTAFGLWWNRTHDGLGQVFAERPRSVVIHHDEALATLIAYIHNNPVRAGVVSNPLDSDWTSHRAYVGETTAPRWLRAEWTLAAMGFSSSPSGRMSFHHFVCSRAHLARDPRLAGPGHLPPGAANQLRDAVAVAMEVGPKLVMKPGLDKSAARAKHVFLHIARFTVGLTGVRLSSELGVSQSAISKALQRIQSIEPPSAGLIARIMDIFLDASGRNSAGRE